MKNKLLLTLAIILLISSSTSCNFTQNKSEEMDNTIGNTSEEIKNSSDEIISKEELIYDEKNYKIFGTDKSKSGEFYDYRYIIYDNNNNVIDGGHFERVDPGVVIKNNILKLTFSYGTGTYDCKFYDLQGGKYSPLISSVIEFNETYVVCIDKTLGGSKIIVSNIFNDTQIKKEYYYNFNQHECLPIISSEIDEDSFKMKYYDEEHNEQYAEIYLN